MSEDSDGGDGRTKRVLATAAVLISVAVGAVTLVFALKPDLTPCLGQSSAEFTGAPVFPHVRFRDFLMRSGRTREQVAGELNLLGAEIRFSYQTSGLRGVTLTVSWSLLAVERGGTVGAVLRKRDRLPAMTVTPESCSESGGHDLFIDYPPGPHKRYRVVLELYRGDTFTDRLALAETKPFGD